MTRIVAINGWSASAKIWQPLQAEMGWADSLDIIDLNEPLSFAEWMSRIDARIGQKSVLIGWSLGGMLALAYAAENPHRVSALCTLQANLRFVQSLDWPWAMPLEEFEQFSEYVEHMPAERIARRFKHMMLRGDQYGRSQLKSIEDYYQSDWLPSRSALSGTLELLGNLDLRQLAAKLSVPGLHILGAADVLVPASVSEAMLETFSADNQVQVVPGMSHIPFLEHLSSVKTLLAGFINRHVV